MAEYKSGDLLRWYRSKMMKVDENVEESMEFIGEEGKALGRYYIETRGTGRTWAQPGGHDGRREGSYPGRVDTGKMRDAFGFRTTRQGGSKQLRLGWVSGTRKDYFMHQEAGFEHPSGIDVEGMYALQDSAEQTFKMLREDIENKIRKIK